ncbi:MAG TPA: hypothetical protein VLR90_03080 [Blastocatellia bacterium]|nr:hypothetical protein [Blastocatellia bacterium]
MSSRTPQDIAQWLLSKIAGKPKRTPGGWSILCPAHNDKAASAALYVKPNGVAFKCFIGCTTREFCNSIGIKPSEMFVNGSSGVRGSQILRVYRCFDENGDLAYEHLRMQQRNKKDPKFYYRRYDESSNEIWSLKQGWFELQGCNWRRINKDINGQDVNHDDSQKSPKIGARWFDDTPRVLYNESDLRKAPLGSLVIVPEGEKDAEELKKHGFLSVAYGGTSDWREHFADKLAGFDVVFISDNDPPGRIVAVKAATDTTGKALRVRLIDQMPGVSVGGDYSDWVQAGGADDEFRTLIESTIDFESNIPTPEEDIEVEGEDPPISDDPKRERYLRQILRNRAKVTEALTLFFKAVGFKQDHSRLDNALGTIAPDKLGTIRASHAWIASKYPGGGMSVSTVARDIKKWEEEEAQLGVDLLGYTQGDMNPATGQRYPSTFRRTYLRYVIHAIDIALSTRGDQEYSFDALKRAINEVVQTIPRKLADSSSKTNSDVDNCADFNQPPDLEVIKEIHRHKVAFGLKRNFRAMMLDDLTLEDALEVSNDGYNDATVWAVEHAKPLPNEVLSEASSEIGDHLEILDSLFNNNTMVSKSGHGQQNDDHVLRNEDRELATKLDD